MLLVSFLAALCTTTSVKQQQATKTPAVTKAMGEVDGVAIELPEDADQGLVGGCVFELQRECGTCYSGRSID